MSSDDKGTRPLPSLKPRWIQRLQTRRGLTVLLLVSLGLLLASAFSAWLIVRKYPWIYPFQPSLAPPRSLSELATAYPEIADLLQDPDLDSAYKDFLLAYQEGGLPAAMELARERGLLSSNDELRLTLELDTEDSAPLIAQLEAMGIIVTAAHGNLVEIAVPIELIEQFVQGDQLHTLFDQIGELEHVKRIRLPRYGKQFMGSVESESLPVINAEAWHAAGYRGEGIRIGVLDLGFGEYKRLLGSDLPASVVARSFIYGTEIDQSGTVHGTAVAEIIYDIAPGAELFFAAYSTELEQLEAVNWLVAQGVKIISHSAGSIYGPMDGSSTLAQLVNDTVDKGILWVNAAGNYGDGHYRDTFKDRDGDGYHEFSPGDELMGFIPSSSTSIVLNWNAWDTGDQDFDLYVFDDQGEILASSENVQDGAGDETMEYLDLAFFDEGPYYLAFYARRVTRPVLFDLFVHYAELEYFTPQYSVTTPGDAMKSFTVGATLWSNDRLELYSSQGPTQDGRLKPEISAPAGVTSAVYGKEFTGTSASAPHVSAAAALVWQAHPEFSVDQVKEYLLQRAIDLGASGPDNGYGYGRLWLGDVFGAPSTPTSESPTDTATQPSETVTVVQKSPTPTQPTTSSTESNANEALWLFFGCVVLPGALGVGSVGLVVVVVMYWRSNVPPSKPQPPPSITPAPAQPHPMHVPLASAPQPQIGQAVKTCPQCGSPQRAQARHCTKCGYAFQDAPPAHRQPTFCTYCGAVLRATSTFCPQCGRKIPPIG